MKTVEIETKKRNDLVTITNQVREIVKESGVNSGICVLWVPHTTAAVTVNENADPDVKDDILRFLSDKIPVSYGFKHIEGNSDAHIKSTLIGPSLSLIIENGDIVLGRWQNIYFYEGDGPRHRKIYIQIVGN